MIEPKPITTTAADFCETRQNTLHMRWPADADTTRRLEQLKYVVDGRNPLPWTGRLMRWLRKR